MAVRPASRLAGDLLLERDVDARCYLLFPLAGMLTLVLSTALFSWLEQGHEYVGVPITWMASLQMPFTSSWRRLRHAMHWPSSRRDSASIFWMNYSQSLGACIAGLLALQLLLDLLDHC